MVSVELLRYELKFHGVFDTDIRQDGQHRGVTLRNLELRGPENEIASGQSLQHLRLARSEASHLVERNKLAHACYVSDEFIVVLSNLVLEAVQSGLHALALFSPFFAQQTCQGLRISLPEENQLFIVHFVLRLEYTLAAE